MIPDWTAGASVINTAKWCNVRKWHRKKEEVETSRVDFLNNNKFNNIPGQPYKNIVTIFPAGLGLQWIIIFINC